MTILRTLIICFLVGSFTHPAAAQFPLWERVRQKMTSPDSYSLLCDYLGPEGSYHFNYVVHDDGKQILTEVLDGSTRGAGTRIYWNPAKDSQNVFMQTRFMRLRRSLQARDIKDSPLYQPLFRHLLSELKRPEPNDIVDPDSQRVTLVFGNPLADHDRLVVDPEGNPLSLRRMEKGEEINRLTFRDLEWGEKPIKWNE